MQQQVDVQIRNFQWADFPTIVAIHNRCAEADDTDYRMRLEDAEHEWRTPPFDPEREAFVALNEAGEIIAFGGTETASIPYRGYGFGAVLPEYRGQGIGTRLLRLGDDDFYAGAVERNPSEATLYVQRWTDSNNTSARQLFEAEGYFVAREFLTLYYDLKEPLAPVAMPEGLEIRPFDPEKDAYNVYYAHQESFRDHWGHDEDEPYEEWRRFRVELPNFDPSLYYVAYEGDEVAGVSLCRAWGESKPELGWLNTLAVRRPWRKRGLGMALLLYTFYEFQQRGFTIAGLGADSQNKTNAVALYERAGMYVHKRGLNYRKVLRGDAAAIKD